MGTDVEIMVQTPYDEFHFRMHGRIASIAVNTSKVPMLPWEALFWEPGKVDGISQATTLPSSLIADHKNVRHAVLKLLPAEGKYTLKFMKKEVGAKLKGLLSLHRPFALEWEFLSSVAPAKATQAVHDLVLASLLDEEHPITTKEPLAKLDEIRKSNLVYAAGSEIEEEVDGLRSLVEQLLQGVGPTQRSYSSYSGFYKSCLYKMAFFVHAMMKKKCPSVKGSLGIMKKKVFGLEALECLMDEMQANV